MLKTKERAALPPLPEGRGIRAAKLMINHPNRGKADKPFKVTRSIAQKVLKVVDAGLVAGVGDPEPGKMCVEAAVCYALGEPHGDRPTCISPVLRSLKIRLNDSAWTTDQARTDGLRRLAIAQLGTAGFLDESEFIKRVLGAVIRKTYPVAFRAVAAVTKDKTRKAKWTDLAARCGAAPEHIEPREARQFFRELKENCKAANGFAADAAAYAYAAAAADAYAAYAAADADAAYAAAAYAYAADAAAYAYAADAAYAYAAAAWRKKYSVARDKSLTAFCEEVVQVLVQMKAPGCQFLDLAAA